MEPHRALELVDQLDRLIRDAKAVPLTPQVRVDQGEALELIAELRRALVVQD